MAARRSHTRKHRSRELDLNSRQLPFAIAFLVLTALCACNEPVRVTQPQQPPPSGIIEGAVKDNGDKPLQGVVVEASSDGGVGVAGSSITDDKGFYIIRSLAPGVYVVRSELPTGERLIEQTQVSSNRISVVSMRGRLGRAATSGIPNCADVKDPPFPVACFP